MRFEEKMAKPSRVRCVIPFLLLCFMLAGASSALAQAPQRTDPIDKDPNNWLTFYGNHQGWSYSRLNQITRENVKQLVPVWAFPAGFAPTNLGLRQGLEAAPLVLDGVLYLEGMQNNLYAIEATTGKTLWSYIHPWPQQGPAPQSPRGARGLAYGDGKVYMGTQDNHLIAFDPESGKQVWNVQVEDAAQCQTGDLHARLSERPRRHLVAARLCRRRRRRGGLGQHACPSH